MSLVPSYKVDWEFGVEVGSMVRVKSGESF